MGALGRLALAVALVVASPAQADPVTRWRVFTSEASSRFGVPVDWIERVMRVESGGLTAIGGRPTTSPKGAMGLMQVMPETWAAMRWRYGLGADPYDPRDNILAGTAYLRLMYDRFGFPGLFGAYNAGPARYAAYLGGQSLPSETRRYVVIFGANAQTRPAQIEVSRPPPSSEEIMSRDGGDPRLFAIRRDAN